MWKRILSWVLHARKMIITNCMGKLDYSILISHRMTSLCRRVLVYVYVECWQHRNKDIERERPICPIRSYHRTKVKFNKTRQTIYGFECDAYWMIYMYTLSIRNQHNFSVPKQERSSNQHQALFQSYSARPIIQHYI